MIRVLLIASILIASPAVAATFDPDHVPVSGNGGNGFPDATDDWSCIRLLTNNSIALVGDNGEGVVITIDTDEQRKYFEGHYQQCPDPK